MSVFRPSSAHKTCFFVVWLIVGQFVLSLAHAAEDVASTQKVPLEIAADRIFPGDHQTILAVSDEDRAGVLVNMKIGKSMPKVSFAGTPIAVVPVQIESGLSEQLVLSSLDLPGQYALEVLNPLTNATSRLNVFNDYARNALSRLQNPMVRAVFGGSPTPQILVWDHALAPSTDSYRIISPKGVVENIAKQYPYELLNVGSTSFMLALHPRDDSASLLNLDEGFAEVGVFVDGLSFDDPSQFAVFVPAQISGGTGDIVIANGQARRLTVLHLEQNTTRQILRPQIGTPIYINLDGLGATEAKKSRLLLAANNDLSFILVGEVGSNQIDIFRKTSGSGGVRGGGLEEVKRIKLEWPIRDVTVIEGPVGAATSTFVFLRDDGRELMSSTDLLGLGERTPQPPPELEPSDVVFANTKLAPLGVTGLQRLLAVLGYSIGAIDGKYGAATAAAIRAFQIDRSIDSSGEVDEKTVAALNAAINEVAKRGEADVLQRNAYREFMNERVKGLNAEQLLTLGLSNRNPASKCFGQNSSPPREFWGNSVGFARILKRLEDDFGFKIEIVSGYRSAVYARCLTGVAIGSHHLKFEAFDIRLADRKNKPEDIRRLREALVKLRSESLFQGGIDDLHYAVHVDTRGVNVDFGDAAQKANSSE